MAFANTALVAVRESLEAFLILGILVGIVRKAGFAGRRRFIAWGAFGGFAASLLLGVLANGVARELYNANAPLFEAGTSFLAVGILTYMAVWMYKHTQEMIGALHQKTKAALGAGRPALLVGLSFLAIFREGVETVLFTSTNLPRDGAVLTLSAIALGIAISAVVAFLVFAGIVRLSIESFMAATGIVLLVMAAGMLVYGLHELSETDALHGLKDVPRAFDVRDVLPSNGAGDDPDINTPVEAFGAFLAGAFGYRDRPTWLELGAWLVYLAVMGTWTATHARGRRKAKAKPSE